MEPPCIVRVTVWNCMGTPLCMMPYGMGPCHMGIPPVDRLTKILLTIKINGYMLEVMLHCKLSWICVAVLSNDTALIWIDPDGFMRNPYGLRGQSVGLLAMGCDCL